MVSLLLVDVTLKLHLTLMVLQTFVVDQQLLLELL